MTLWIDRSINFFKYPVALLAMVNLAFFGQKSLLFIGKSFQGDGLYFWAGTFCYAVMWKILFSQRYVGSFLPTLIHELIHALVAVLTLHRVVDFMVRWEKGGHIRYVGGTGNWLITIAPYFFPLAFCFVALVSFLIEIPSPEKEMFFGVVWGFESMFQWKQLHWKQPDLAEVGFIFVGLFLPTAIFLSQCLIFGLMFQGFSSLPTLWADCIAYNQNLYQWLMKGILSF